MRKPTEKGSIDRFFEIYGKIPTKSELDQFMQNYKAPLRDQDLKTFKGRKKYNKLIHL